MTKTKDNDGDLIQTKTLFRRHSKGPVMFSGCSPLGEVIIIDNISPAKSYDLKGWYIERQTDSQPFLRYTFTDQITLPPLTTIELWSSTATLSAIEPNQSEESQQQSAVRVKTRLLTWNLAKQWSINRLFDSNGREKAIFSHRILTPIEQANAEE